MTPSLWPIKTRTVQYYVTGCHSFLKSLCQLLLFFFWQLVVISVCGVEKYIFFYIGFLKVVLHWCYDSFILFLYFFYFLCQVKPVTWPLIQQAEVILCLYFFCASVLTGLDTESNQFKTYWLIYLDGVLYNVAFLINFENNQMSCTSSSYSSHGVIIR